jgi:hypothetical protein
MVLGTAFYVFFVALLLYMLYNLVVTNLFGG